MAAANDAPSNAAPRQRAPRARVPSCADRAARRGAVAAGAAARRARSASGPADRVRERAGHLDVDRAIWVGRHAARVGELAQPLAVRPHREELVAERVCADGIAVRREQNRSADLVDRRADRPDAEWGERAAVAPGPAVPRKVRELAELVTTCADGEELADLVRVLAAVHRCREERPVTDDQATTAFGAGGRVLAVERGQLQDLLGGVDKEDLAHETS